MITPIFVGEKTGIWTKLICPRRGQELRPRDLIQAEHPFPESSAYEKV